MSFAAALALARSRPNDPSAFEDLAEKAQAEGEEELALPDLRQAAARLGQARLWQWVGLLHRSLDEHAEALEALGEASRLAPNDASIAHGLARVRLEAGLDARPEFDRALKLVPSGDVLLGRAAAQYAAGEGVAAAQQLYGVLEHNPQWAQGHVQWAQLCSMIGQPDKSLQSIERALAQWPGETPLWQAAIRILTGAGRHDEAWQMADRAIAATGDGAAFALSRAAALSDAGQVAPAGEAFAGLGEPATIDHAIRLARHRIRAGDADGLAALADRWMEGGSAHFFWPYASIAWRQSGDPRREWLEGDPRLVQIFDLSAKLPRMDALAAKLRQLHGRSGRFLDQSVRGGTQTDGPLLARVEPEIRALRAAIVEAVEAYRVQLPPVDPKHPMLRHRRDGRVRFAGSWSVRLSGAGFHSAHVHPQGWISSAFYVALPESSQGEEGRLVLGQPHEDLSSGLGPIRKIEPKAGQLVLFPSMMWHGTLPVPEGERMTVAFDVAPPR